MMPPWSPMIFATNASPNPVPDGLVVTKGSNRFGNRSSGSGLGLALVAKIVGDHGGIIECESQPRRTIFRILMPMYTGTGAEPNGALQPRGDH